MREENRFGVVSPQAGVSPPFCCLLPPSAAEMKAVS